MCTLGSAQGADVSAGPEADCCLRAARALCVLWLNCWQVEEEAKAVFNALNLFENLVEVDPQVADLVRCAALRTLCCAAPCHACGGAREADSKPHVMLSFACLPCLRVG